MTHSPGTPFGESLASSLLLLAGCLSTLEPKAPTPGVVSPWSTEFSRIDWMSEWSPKKTGAFGRDNTSVEEDAQSPGGRFLRVRYYKGGASPSASRRDGFREGGAQVLGTFESGPVDHVFLRYFVRFPANFEFVKGGKLPGLVGGSAPTGCVDDTTGFSARMMWRTGGAAVQYMYFPEKMNACGDDYPYTSGGSEVVFEPGTWHTVEHRLVMNTPGEHDGVLQAWFDKKPALDEQAFLFRLAGASYGVDTLYFSTFFGGSDGTWAPPSAQTADFDDFIVSTGPIMQP